MSLGAATPIPSTIMVWPQTILSDIRITINFEKTVTKRLGPGFSKKDL